MIKMWGLDPTVDVTLVQLNEMGLLVQGQGLVNGVIDAAPISIPSNIRAKNLGFVELFDMTKINKTYITGTVVTRKRFIEGQRDIAKRFMRGFLEGMRTYLEDEEFSVKVIQKWTRIEESRRDQRGLCAAGPSYAQSSAHFPRRSENDSRRFGSHTGRQDSRPAALCRFKPNRRAGERRIS